MTEAKIWEHIAAAAERIGAAKKSVLGPLQWGLGLLTTGAVWSTIRVPESWLAKGLGALTLAGWLLFGYVYVHFARKNPDLLRSESYSLQKMALERTLRGDSDRGLIDPVRILEALAEGPVTAGPQESARDD